MGVAVITGSAGLIGSEASIHFAGLGLDVLGIDNDMRKSFFGPDASTAWSRSRLEQRLGAQYTHLDLDVRDRDGILALFARHGKAIELVIHAAAQPSHDWAAGAPLADFDINAGGTVNVLEATRAHAPYATFIFCSTNKVYGDLVNTLPFVELSTRYEIEPGHIYETGITETMSTDTSLHSVFGASKLSADLMVQEYGRYFGMRTACFRAGTLTGPLHAATQLHGFLGYLVRCSVAGTPYTINGYKGKQVRDVLHSQDLVSAFAEVFQAPREAEVYNIGGGRQSNVSVLEAIALTQRAVGSPIDWSYADRSRRGDHRWWVSDNTKFQSHYPRWSVTFDIEDVILEIYEENRIRWS